MIAPDYTRFPSNVISLFAAKFAEVDSDLPIKMRPLIETDGTQAVGVYPVDYRPDQDTHEMKAYIGGAQVPVLQDYLINIMTMVMDSEQERGIATSSTLSDKICSVVAYDTVLDVALKNLVITESGRIKSARRWGIRRTIYQSGDLRGFFLYVSVSEFWLQTETR